MVKRLRKRYNSSIFSFLCHSSFDRAYFIGVRGESRAFLYLYATDVTRYHQHDLINIAGVVDDALDVVLPTVATIRNSQ